MEKDLPKDYYFRIDFPYALVLSEPDSCKIFEMSHTGFDPYNPFAYISQTTLTDLKVA